MYKQFHDRCASFFGFLPRTVLIVLAFTAAIAAGFATEGQAQGCFIRGDFNNNGVIDGADAADLTGFIFVGVPVPFCMDAADVNDDGICETAGGP